MSIGIRIGGDASMVEQRMRSVAGRQYLDKFDSEQKSIPIKHLCNLRAYMSGIICKKDTITDKNAIKLLLMTPLFLYGVRNSSAVHDAIFIAGNRVKTLYQENPETPLAEQCRNALIIAGKVCFDRHLSPTSTEWRKSEFELFQPFVGDTKEYQAALEKMQKRTRIGLVKLQDFRESPLAYKSNKNVVKNFKLQYTRD